MLTDAQREAAIQLMNDAYWSVRDRTMADALDALLSEFVVLHRDDVTEETIPARYPLPYDSRERRLVTRWEPITNKETNDA